MAEHNIKCVPEMLQSVLDGIKTYEWRLNDRKYEVGDVVYLNEWNGSRYLERVARVRITHLIQGAYGIPPGYCVFAIKLESFGCRAYVT